MTRAAVKVRKAVPPTIARRGAPPSQGPRIGGRLMDARPDRTDLRDLPYRPPLRSLPPAYPGDVKIAEFLPGYIKAGLVLNQGKEGACTGFGLACVVNYLLYVRDGGPERFASVSPRMLYELAKRYDEWPGTDYDGSSCRGALKGWHKHGVCSADHWPYLLDRDEVPQAARPAPKWEQDAAGRPLGVYYRVDRASVVDLQAAIVNIGAVFVSANAHDGWDSLSHARPLSSPTDHGSLPVIPPVKDRESLGGHAFALVGYDDRGFLVQNSWGAKWGRGGFAVLPYEDWVEHATDAWACALGVPVRTAGMSAPIPTTRWRVGAGRSLTTIERARKSPNNPPHDPWPVDHEFEHAAYEPWPTAKAYEHALVSGNDGELVVTDFTRMRSQAAELARELVHEKPRRWFAQAAGTAKLVVYAHGGLNSEDESVKRIRVLAPYFAANGIYPLFLTWKTGPGETLCNMVEDWAKGVVADDVMRSAGLISEAWDRAVEAVARRLGRGIWSEMRENAALGQVDGHGLDLAARNLASLAQAMKSDGRKLELHLVGHSAGAILLGHLLRRMGAGDLPHAPKIASATLLAPACSTRFAVDHYLAAVNRGQLKASDIHLFNLSEENERDDGLPTPGFAAYGKSLLYLVSRALDDARKMPLLGMARALDPRYANDANQWAEGELGFVQAWQAAWPAANVSLVEVRDVRNTRTGGQVQATHGSFDNNIEVLTRVIERVAGAPIAPMEWLDY